MSRLVNNIYAAYKNIGLFHYLKNNFTNEFGGKLQFGANCKIDHSKISGIIAVGDNSIINNSVLSGNISLGKGCKIFHSEMFSKSSLEIGNYTSIWGPNIALRQKIHPIKIGSFCSVARGVSFQEYNHNIEKITTYYIGQNIFNEKWDDESVSKGGIEIGSDVWIGANALILGGAKVGNGCVIAGNAVVNKQYPDYSIIAGIPAKVIGYRFDDKSIEYLNELKWWEWDIEKIKENKSLFMGKFVYHENIK
ncbi:MAG: antibiotic acetyltransferase [Tissierellia bacterium]|nr:antibiotic acetyltransferase [Tissierellia bacterium]MDD4781040.1 antibiotic acetyltransferase [Tissierellia bacterium]